MKLLTAILMFSVFGFASAQTDPKTPPPADRPAVVKPQMDTTSTNQQIKKESDLKTMDAVKTQDHPKTTKKAKDTVATATKRKGSGRAARP